LEVIELGNARINKRVDMIALVAALLIFPTGLVLLTRLHIGPDGQQRLYALGLDRAVWMHLHRWSAVAMTVAVTAHAQMHWRVICARVRRAGLRLSGNTTRSDLVLYFTVAVATFTAFAAWLVLPRSLRHLAIDLHHLSSLILLPAVVTHVRPHLRWLLR